MSGQTVLDIEYNDVPKLMTTFKSFFASHIHIKFKWQKVKAQVEENRTAWITVVNVKVNDTIKGGEGEENWRLDYAYTLLKQPKEMELCATRWLDGFKNAKKKSTLELPGYENANTIN